MKELVRLLFLSTFGFQAFTQSLPKGEVIDTVTTAVAGQTYALYLPTDYTPEKEYPVILFFEPLARGSLPVENYRELAEKYDLILTCSNNSKNYTTPYLSFDAAEIMINDVFSRFSIDKNLVITSGFSGGSRTAIAVATQSPLVKGVIGVGAVGPIFREDALRKHHGIPYAGLVGNRDFNYVEHYIGEKEFTEQGITNIRLVFNKHHSWAPARDYEIALVWMITQLDEGRKTVLEQSLIASYLQQVQDSISGIDAIRVHTYFADLDLELDPPGFSNTDFQKEEKKLLKTIRLEEKLRKQYQDSIDLAFRLPPNKTSNSSMKWIIDTGKSYQRKVSQNENKNPMRAEMYDRMANFIRASSYEHGMEAMVRKNFNRAFISVEIWSSMIDNDGWEYWMKCKLHAMNNDVQMATRYLDKLIKLGFENGNALKADTTFNVLKGTKQYIDLTTNMD